MDAVPELSENSIPRCWDHQMLEPKHRNHVEVTSRPVQGLCFQNLQKSKNTAQTL